ncbi:MAG: sulfur oxidation c-type cytochrome SoxX [Beijerinckiaceae bacterium]
MTASLTGEPGDAARGRIIVADRRKGLCLLCHSGPFPEERFQGTLAPSLSGVGTRMSAAEIRLRLVDSRMINPATIMPAYFSTQNLVQVANNFRDRTILSASEIEDVIAFLLTLKE